jgi:predicted HicB family RNase H-like nuclease
LSDRHYSGEFRVRIPPEVHRTLALQAAEQGVSLNRLASAKLAAF